MSARIIDGRRIAQEERAVLRGRIDVLVRRGLRPGLAVVMVGEDAASKVYVRNKVRACEELGMRSEGRRFPHDAAQEAVVGRIRELNNDPAVHGIIVQLPLPKRFDLRAVVEFIAVHKDADGLLREVARLHMADGVHHPRRHSARRRRQAEAHSARDGPARCRGDRRGDQPAAEKASYITPVPGG